MALIKCPECNCKLTSMHAVCPNCAIVLSEEKTSDNNYAISPFSVWEGTDDKDQIKRFSRASERKNTPTEIYTDSNSATFNGSHGVYHTSLDFCECRDFAIRKLPCKHIYRLAIELGLINANLSSDRKATVESTDVALNSPLVLSEEKTNDNNYTIPPFSVWEGTDDQDQIKRFSRASESRNTPIEVDTDSNSAAFSGSHGVYHTSLDFCECRDFSMRKLPCKHIYRLAMELGLISTKFSSDKKAIKAPTDIALGSAIDFLEENYCDKLPFLEYLLYCYTTKRKCFCENIDVYKAAIDIGFIRAEIDYYCIFEQKTQKKTIEDAEKAKLAFPEELKTKKSKFLWCKDNAELFNKTVYPDAAVIYPDGYMLQSARSIYSYLLRRNDQETFYLSELENLPKMVVQKLLEYCPDKIIR